MKATSVLGISRLFALSVLVLLPFSLQASLPQAVAGQPLPSLAPMLEKTTPAVVNIATMTKVQQRVNPLLQDPFFRRFFNVPNGPLPERQARSAGSGVIIDAKEGHVLTNAHVVDGADEVEMTLLDGRTLKAQIVGVDREVDLAVLKVEADDLTEIAIANADELRVGDFVVAIGNPFGLGQTVTDGIISALNRSGLGIGYENFIQTSAPINPGNSGGALVNLRGELVGINTAIIAPAGGNVGIGFAIPTDMVQNVMTQLIEHGEVKRGLLGVTVQDLTPELAEAFGLEKQSGVVITQVMEDSSAADAGIEPGDVVLEVDGRPVKRSADLRNSVGLSPVGEKIELNIVRDGKAKTIIATIRESNEIAAEGGALSKHLDGASLRTLREGELPYAQSGVLVEGVEQGSAAWRAGLRIEDVIINVNRQDVTDMETLRDAISDKEGTVLLRINRKGGVFFSVMR